MDKQVHQQRKAEHRLARFLLRRGLGYKRGSKVWKHMENREGDVLFTFEQISTVVPSFNLDLSYLQLSRKDRPTLQSLVSRKRTDQLIQTLPLFENDHQLGRVFNLGGIKGGLIIHNFVLPSDRRSASMLWEQNGCRVRLQRFAEFCETMKSIDWKMLSKDPRKAKPVHEALIYLSKCDLKPISLRIILHIMSCVGDPQRIRNLQASGFGVESQIDEGSSYLVLAHARWGELFDCNKSSIKRSFEELVDRKFVESKRFGRYTGYRCNLNIKWGVIK